MAHFYAIARGNEYEYDDEELQPLERTTDGANINNSHLFVNPSSSLSTASSSSSSASPNNRNSSTTLLSTTVQGVWTRLYHHGRVAFRRVFAPDPYMRRLNVTIYSIGVFLLITALFIPSNNNKNLIVSITLITLGLALTINGIRFLTLCYSSLRYGTDSIPSVSVRSRVRPRPLSSSSSISRIEGSTQQDERLSPHDLVSIIIQDALRNDNSAGLPSHGNSLSTAASGSSQSSSTSGSLTTDQNNHRFTSSIHLSRRQVNRLRQAGFSDESIASFAIIAAAQRSNLTILGNYESLIELDATNNDDFIIPRNGQNYDPLTNRRPQGASLQEIYRLPSYIYHAKHLDTDIPDISKNIENLEKNTSTSDSISTAKSSDTVTGTEPSAVSTEPFDTSKTTFTTNTSIASDTVSTMDRTSGNLNTCQICLEDYIENDDIRILPCIHSFHMDCIDTWLIQKSVCPVCRVNIREA